jgi:hypothetical protein
MPDSHHAELVEVAERPISISNLVRTLRAYAPVILLSMCAVAAVYTVIAITVYVFSPTQRVTTQKFRLDFEGASEAHYPNGTKFASSDITSTPILLKVYHDNQLDRFTRFADFSRALFVLEANPDYERLAADYQARLADPRLSAVDRERIQREWQAKAASLTKNDLSLNWLRTKDTAAVPESVVRKVLSDVLAAWAAYAANEQHVLKYRIAVFSPQVIGSEDSDGEPAIGLQVLRSKIYKVLQNIDELRQVPGSELVRSAAGTSLEEIRLRLEEIVRFRLEPLTGRVVTSGLIANRMATTRFLESQLAYDQRQLKATQDYADSIRQSLSVYVLEERGYVPDTAAATSTAAPREPQPRLAQRPDTVMPQVTEGFLDRIVSLSTQATDAQYRQRLVDDYRKAAQSAIPAQQAVSYDQEVLSLIKSAPNAGAPQTADVMREIASTQTEVRGLIGQVNQIYNAISSNLSPSKELFTPTAPPITRTEHARNLPQLALYGLALLALSLPVIVILCLIHARIRAEEAAGTAPPWTAASPQQS